MKKICIVTATRAEYGLLKPLMAAVSSEKDWTLQILVTGSHLSPEFGLTYKQIEKEGFAIDKKIEMLLSADTSTSIIKSMGVGMIGYADALQDLKPDLLVILGDRYEMLSIAISALILKIPIVHIHGGEITEGAYDDAIRHAITKMSHIHFASTEVYRNRIIQMGEQPDHVFNAGAIGIDNVKNLSLLTKEELEKELDVRFGKYNFQVTFHPTTLDKESPQKQFAILLEALQEQEDCFFIFTKANADTDGRIINQMIDEFVDKHSNKTKSFHSLGSLRFLSLVKICDAIIGNSSSGILEAPSLHTATINIGDRQKGRIQADSIVNTGIDKNEILKAMELVKTAAFKEKVVLTTNPYGEGNATQKIVNVLRNLDVEKLVVKKFCDLQEK